MELRPRVRLQFSHIFFERARIAFLGYTVSRHWIMEKDPMRLPEIIEGRVNLPVNPRIALSEKDLVDKFVNAQTWQIVVTSLSSFLVSTQRRLLLEMFEQRVLLFEEFLLSRCPFHTLFAKQSKTTSPECVCERARFPTSTRKFEIEP